MNFWKMKGQLLNCNEAFLWLLVKLVEEYEYATVEGIIGTDEDEDDETIGPK